MGCNRLVILKQLYQLVNFILHVFSFHSAYNFRCIQILSQHFFALSAGFLLTRISNYDLMATYIFLSFLLKNWLSPTMRTKERGTGHSSKRTRYNQNMKDTTKFPSVTTVLGVYNDFSGIRPNVLEIASSRGTEVHGICSAIAQREWVPDIPSDCAPYVLSFQQWFDKNIKEVHLVEQRLIDMVYGFTGCPDLVLTMRDDARILVDLKTPQVKGKLWSSQLAAYRYLIKEGSLSDGTSPRLLVDRVGSLRLSAKGSSPIFDEYQDSTMDFVAFLAALSAYKYFKETN